MAVPSDVDIRGGLVPAIVRRFVHGGSGSDERAFPCRRPALPRGHPDSPSPFAAPGDNWLVRGGVCNNYPEIQPLADVGLHSSDPDWHHRVADDDDRYAAPAAWRWAGMG